MPQIETKQVEPDIVLLEISGRITLGRECQAVEWAIDDLIKSRRLKVVLDLSKLDYVDSSGIGILVVSRGRMEAAGGELRMACVQPKVAEVIRVSKLTPIMGRLSGRRERARELQPSLVIAR